MSLQWANIPEILNSIQRDPWPVPSEILQQAKLCELATREESPRVIQANQKVYETKLMSLWHAWKNNCKEETVSGAYCVVRS